MVNEGKFVERDFAEGDRRSVWIRPAVQTGFVLFSVLLGLEFHGFVVSLESGGPLQARPAAVDAYLPISSLLSLTYWLKTGVANNVRPAGLIIFSQTIALAIIIRRGFCSWVCPIGTASEFAYKAGQRILGITGVPPRWIDVPLRSLKYLLLGFFLYSVLWMSADELYWWINGPYNRVADIKMYLFFRNMSTTAAAALAILAVLSLLIKNFWCRYLCPYGALLGIGSVFSPFAVRRDDETCAGCGACARACPNQIAVDCKKSVHSTLCTACLSCINACKIPGALEVSAAKKFRFSAASYALVIILSFMVVAQAAKSSGYWHSTTPPEMYRMLYSRISEIAHP